MNILIVDDSKPMRMIVQRTLRQAGFTEHTFAEADSGVSALALLRQQKFDLVLSDWNMPSMTGIELLGAVNAEKIPVVFGFVTSESTSSMRDQASAAGATFLIAKPFTADVFKQTLHEFLTV